MEVENGPTMMASELLQEFRVQVLEMPAGDSPEDGVVRLQLMLNTFQTPWHHTGEPFSMLESLMEGTQRQSTQLLDDGHTCVVLRFQLGTLLFHG